jgi:uncharacterized protein YndB with AHSA1/START domain
VTHHGSTERHHDIPRTFGSGPSDPLTLTDEPGTWAEIVIAAPPEQVWELVSDIELPARFSEEFLGASWVGEGPAVGASFVGRSSHPTVGEWEAESFVEVYEEGRRFGWATVDLSNPGSRWCFALEPVDGGTRLRFSMSIGPGPSGLSIAIEAMPDKEPRILERRLTEHHANMTRTLRGIAELAEAAGPA